MKIKLLLLIALLTPLHMFAGFFFDDPIEIKSQILHHLFANDEIMFSLNGKCEQFMIYDVEVTLELKYSSGTKKLYASRKTWMKSDDDKYQLIISLPDGTADLQSFILTGKFSVIVKPTGYRPHFTYDENGHVEPLSREEFDKAFKGVDGYKIDSSWYMK